MMIEPLRRTDCSGPELFVRYARPPNRLGYCGPDDTLLLDHLMAESTPERDELAESVHQFDGAYPYLELIAAATTRHPLNREVIEAYWTGNSLLGEVDTLLWGNSLDDRFRRRAGREWATVEQAILLGGLPTHAFHVFCVYPWVGLLRSGAGSPALEVLDRCRISWGEVVGWSGDGALVSTRRLALVDDRLELAVPEVTVAASPPYLPPLGVGDVVSLHWDTACERLSAPRLNALQRIHRVHLAMANTQLSSKQSPVISY